MPRASTPKTPTKPYLPRVSSSPTTSGKGSKVKEESSAPPASNSSVSAASRRWTNAEYLQLFNHVAANTGNFDGAVAGRTRNQAYQAWRCTVLPFITNSLMAKDGGTAGGPTTPAKTRVKTKARNDDVIDNDENQAGVKIEGEDSDGEH